MNKLQHISIITATYLFTKTTENDLGVILYEAGIKKKLENDTKLSKHGTYCRKLLSSIYNSLFYEDKNGVYRL